VNYWEGRTKPLIKNNSKMTKNTLVHDLSE